MYFIESIIRNFSPDRNTTSDLAPPRHNSSMNDYINDFIAYALRIGITSEQHQVNLFINSLQHALREAVVRHHPRAMEKAIDLARTLETPAPASTKTGRSNLTDSNRPDITPRGNTGHPTTSLAKQPPHRPSATIDTLALAGNNTRAVARVKLDPKILTQLRLATSDEHEL